MTGVDEFIAEYRKTDDGRGTYWPHVGVGTLIAEITRLRAELASAREDALREAAKVCETEACRYGHDAFRVVAVLACANVILALIPRPAAPPTLHTWLGAAAEEVG